MPDDKRQENKSVSLAQSTRKDDFVLEKSIFSAIFDKDIQRVYIYKKAERLAKATHLIRPALATSPALAQRADAVAIALIDAAILPPLSSRAALSRELLALSSILAIARANGSLSAMNSELIAREAQLLLQEIAAYEAPRLALEDAPSLGTLTKRARPLPQPPSADKGHIKDTEKNKGRRDGILAVIKDKGSVYIKDISKIVRNVSEKTIQRELAALVKEGIIVRKGERRWTLYSLA